MKKLTDLKPEWLGFLRPQSGEGLSFDCPNCTEKPHKCVVYFKNPLDGGEPATFHKPHQLWERNGEQLDNISVAPSVMYPCFHGWVELGRVFDMSESPCAIPSTDDKGQGILIALSPLQTIAYAEAISKKAMEVIKWTFESANDPS